MAKAEKPRSISRDVWWGIKHALLLAALFGGVAVASLLAAAVGGALRDRDLPAGLAVALTLYTGGAVVAGALVGALRPYTRSRRGAILVGTIALTPCSLSTGLLIVHLGGGWPESRIYPYYFAAAVLFLSWIFSLAYVRGSQPADEPTSTAVGSRRVV